MSITNLVLIGVVSSVTFLCRAMRRGCDGELVVLLQTGANQWIVGPTLRLTIRRHACGVASDQSSCTDFIHDSLRSVRAKFQPLSRMQSI